MSTMLLPSSACFAMALLSTSPCSTATLQRAHRPSLILMSAGREPSEDWRPDEDWALMDAVPAFTAGEGAQVATFWAALAASTPLVAARTPVELEQRWADIAPESEAASAGKSPAILEDWTKLPDGRYAGRVDDGSTVWLTVAVEGKLASDPRESPGYIEALGGRIYELAPKSNPGDGAGAPPAAAAASPLQPTAAAAVSDLSSVRLPYAAVAVLTGLIVGAIGYGVGVASVPPPPPPPPATKIFLAPPSPSSTSNKKGLQPAAGAPAAPLTVGEQRERAQLRLDRDKARLKMIEQKIREDEERVAEFRRVEAERGATSEAVKLIFPPAAPGQS